MPLPGLLAAVGHSTPEQPAYRTRVDAGKQCVRLRDGLNDVSGPRVAPQRPGGGRRNGRQSGHNDVARCRAARGRADREGHAAAYVAAATRLAPSERNAATIATAGRCATLERHITALAHG